MSSAADRPLWRCPQCGERFVTKNMWHSCGKFDLKALFANSDPCVFKLFKKFEKMMRACGPLRMIPQKTRVVFQVRVRFGGCYPRKNYLLCSLALARTMQHPRIHEITKYARHFIGHMFRIRALDELDDEIQAWMRESYEAGGQKPLMEHSEKRKAKASAASKRGPRIVRIQDGSASSPKPGKK